MQIVFIDEF